MKITFSINDEKTITNTTAKITISIKGTINGESRDKLEARTANVTKTLFPDNQWAFTDFGYNADGFTFHVSATTRIDSLQNDQLAEKCESLGSDTLRVILVGVDDSIPSHVLREAESDLRLHVIALAEQEAIKLGGKVVDINFNSPAQYRGIVAASATYADSSKSLGHSEKIQINANVVVER